ncbi:hypothetical protein ACJIZ3_008760 [Penstemon smallii]|uniref:Vps72/YL1 C-terminal domain-containing protein n=1 Tax=Penstemon smallii TaxID=265156 RepID=A0ABD3TAP2_9LAMI
MDSNKEHVFLDRVSRATRGKRMTKLLDDEIEEDEVFWNQDALKDEENDIEYEAEAEVADVFDSDFDEDEPEADPEVENEPKERTKKKLILPGKPTTKKKSKSKVISKLGVAPKNEKTPEQSTPSEHHDVPDDVESEKIVRKSTRTSVVIRQAERDAIRAAVQATMKPMKKKKEGEEKRMTQEEMLLEAAQTEIMNLRNLERMLAREEEVKKRAIVHKEVYCGPQIQYISRNGYSYLDFINGASFESEVSTTSSQYPEKAVCAITGLPAIYRDPKTGLPYATKEAFKIIREQFAKENRDRCSKKESNMGGLLSDEQGFSQKRKRSFISHNKNKNETSHFRHHARFRTIPALQLQDSD